MKPAATAAASPQAQSFNPYILGARGLFSFTVFFCHVTISRLPTFSGLSGAAMGEVFESLQYGVELFFCISGYVITGSLLRHRSLFAFLCDRAIRIYPVLWATLPILVVLGILNTWSTDRGAWLTILAALPANLLALPNFFPGYLIHPAAWSLSYEGVFYVASACVVLSSRQVGFKAAVLIGILASLLLANHHPRMLFFLCGIFAFHPAMTAYIPNLIMRVPEAWLIVFLAAWRTVQLLSPADITTSGTLVEWAGDGRIALAALAFVSATIGFTGIAQGRGALGVLLRSRPAAFAGRISYSFYLWHPIVLAISKRALVLFGVIDAVGPWSQVVFFAVGLPVSVGISVLSRDILEVRASRWLHAKAQLGLGRSKSLRPGPVVGRHAGET